MIQEFFKDRVELFELLDETTLHLERHPDDSSALNAIFRTVHTIKETAGMLGLADLEALFQPTEIGLFWFARDKRESRLA